MPPVTWHKYKQTHDLYLNININKTLKDYEDWKIISLFYCLLHSVDEYLGEYPRLLHPENHNERKYEIANHLGSIKRDYLIIKYISEDARYRKNISKQDFIKFLQKYGKLKKYLTPKNCPNCGAPNRLNTGTCIICQHSL